MVCTELHFSWRRTRESDFEIVLPGSDKPLVASKGQIGKRKSVNDTFIVPFVLVAASARSGMEFSGVQLDVRAEVRGAVSCFVLATRAFKRYPNPIWCELRLCAFSHRQFQKKLGLGKKMLCLPPECSDELAEPAWYLDEKAFEHGRFLF
jgi:hypothetical protein